MIVGTRSSDKLAYKLIQVLLAAICFLVTGFIGYKVHAYDNAFLKLNDTQAVEDIRITRLEDFRAEIQGIREDVKVIREELRKNHHG